jgi:hypothetical protein
MGCLVSWLLQNTVHRAHQEKEQYTYSSMLAAFFHNHMVRLGPSSRKLSKESRARKRLTLGEAEWKATWKVLVKIWEALPSQVTLWIAPWSRLAQGPRSARTTPSQWPHHAKYARKPKMSTALSLKINGDI